jgi:LuxR family maltose regulon positive regulatory protein
MSADDTGTPAAGESISHSVPSTKYRRPRLHPDMVPREALVQRLFIATMQHRVCIVRAPGGYGKTTLLTQLAQRCDADGAARSVWLSLDEGENDVNRLLMLLLCALHDLALHWVTEPQLLASQVRLSGPQAHAAVAVIVNALQSHRAGRLLIVLDDLHCVVDKAANAFIALLVDLLPPHVGLLVGSRTDPELPTARWRLRGELATLGSQDLQFNAADARKMVRRTAAARLDDAGLQQALARSEGWAAGLQLILRSRTPETQRQAAAQGTDKALFDYFANESFATLPQDLQDFLLKCCVLDELSPTLCRAVTGRDDSHSMLSSLVRQNLFLTAIDEVKPVLRLHELFAKFLRHKLEQQGEDTVRALHARAAAAEQPLRAVAHWLAAQDWAAAVEQMAQAAPPLLAEGGEALLARWLACLPTAFAQHSAEAQQLHAMVSANRWDFASATAHMEIAMQAYRAEGRERDFLTCAALLPRLCHAAGLLDKGADMLAFADGLPLDPQMRLMADSARVWQCLATRPDAVAPLLETIAAQGQTNPALLPAVIENLNVPHFYGMPGVLPVMRRLRELCLRQRGTGDPSWQLAAMSATVWPELWQGERRAAEAAIARSAKLYEQLAVVPTTRFNTMAEHAFFAHAAGNGAEAVRLQRDICDQMSTISPGFSATWQRPIQFCLARLLLVAGDHEALRSLWPLIKHPRTAVEYPVVDALRTRFLGHMAWLDGDLATAQHQLEEAAALEVHWRLPTLFADARSSLALVRLARGDATGAWNSLTGLLDDMLADDCVGPLLMESQADRRALVGLIPSHKREQQSVQRLLERLAAWQLPEAGRATVVADPLDSLSPRERAVLARLAAGDSNQLIAKTLHISLHTVKRHVVSVLAKLGCDTRGQAAARWHASPG